MYNSRNVDPKLKKTFSFPNSDQYTEQAISEQSTESATANNFSEINPKKTVSLMDALAMERKNEGEVHNIRTYQSDIADTIRNDNVSMIKVALSEKKRQERRGTLDTALEDSKKNLYIVIGAIVGFVVIAGFVAGYIFLQSQNVEPIEGEVQQKVQPLLYTETTSVLNIDQINISDLSRIIEKDKEAVMELGDMKAIVLTTGSSTQERQLTSTEFFQALNARIPDSLGRAFGSNFLLGVYAFTPREMFAVFQISSYDAAFAGMLEWEPNIESDIGDIFMNKKDRIKRDLNTISQENSPFGILSQRKFVDRLLSNKDARVLIDADNKDFMLYTFLDKETLVIATSEKSLKEVIFRLTTGRIVR